MRKLSRRHKENVEKTKNKIYSNLDQAIEVLQETASAKFVESVELHANLNIYEYLRGNIEIESNVIVDNDLIQQEVLKDGRAKVP